MENYINSEEKTVLTLKEIDAIPNPSRGLNSILLRMKGARFYKVSEENESLSSLISKPIVKSHIALGGVTEHCRKSTRGEVTYWRGRSFDALMYSVRRAMFGNGPFISRGYYVGLGKPNKGLFFIDVTEEIIEGVKRIGACFISKSHCEMVEKTKRTRYCKFCNRKEIKVAKKKIKYEWITPK